MKTDFGRKKRGNAKEHDTEDYSDDSYLCLSLSSRGMSSESSFDDVSSESLSLRERLGF